MRVGKEAIETKGSKLLQEALRFVGTNTCNRVSNNTGVFKLISN
jgi:hypothetical protein